MRFLSPGDSWRSKAHRHIEDILLEMNINFESEVVYHPYRLDIYIPEWHVAIEVDGPMHSPKKDFARDNALEISYALPVLHIKTKLGLRKADIVKMITEFFELQADSAEDRKEHARRSS